MAKVLDVGTVHLQQLIDHGINAFAFELMAESVVRDVLPNLESYSGLTFAISVRKRSGERETQLVKFTMEAVTDQQAGGQPSAEGEGQGS